MSKAVDIFRGLKNEFVEVQITTGVPPAHPNCRSAIYVYFEDPAIFNFLTENALPKPDEPKHTLELKAEKPDAQG